MNIEQTISFEDLITLKARFDFAVKVNEAMNSQLFLHLEINVASFALEAQLCFAVLMRNVMMIVSRCLAREEPRAELTFDRKIIAVFCCVMVLKERLLIEDKATKAADVFLDVLKIVCQMIIIVE